MTARGTETPMRIFVLTPSSADDLVMSGIPVVRAASFVTVLSVIVVNEPDAVKVVVSIVVVILISTTVIVGDPGVGDALAATRSRADR
jgi:hypothetical protein